MSLPLAGMQVNFPIGDRGAVFRLSPLTGRADITVGPERFLLQSPFRPSAHFQIRRRRTWRRSVDGHEVEVVKQRPVLLGGFRPTKFTVSADGSRSRGPLIGFCNHRVSTLGSSGTLWMPQPLPSVQDVP